MRILLDSVWQIGRPGPLRTSPERLRHESLIIVMEGGARWVADGQAIDGVSGTLLNFHRGQTRHFILAPGRFVRYVAVRYTMADRSSDDPPWLTLPTSMPLDPDLRDDMAARFLELEREMKERRSHYADAVNLKMQQILLTAHRQVAPDAQLGVSADSGEFSLRHSALAEDFIHHVSRHLAEELSIAELAARYAVSDSHFRRIIRHWTGLTPRDYITRARIERAKELLRSQYSIADAAAATGYPDAAYFSRLFRRQTGHTPSEYVRRQVQRHFGTVF